MKCRISDICRCDNLIIEPFFNDDCSEGEFVIVHSVSGDVLAVFPRGSMSFSFWNFLVYSQCLHLQTFLSMDSKKFRKDARRLSCRDIARKRRSRDLRFANLFVLHEKKTGNSKI